MGAIKSEGKCVFCGRSFGKAAITRHLASHLDKLLSGNAGSGVSYHLRVENSKRWGGGPWFLNLLIDGEKQFRDLDKFLRGIWLECCGHMSGFQIVGAKMKRGFGLLEVLAYMAEHADSVPGEVSMTNKLKTRLKADMELDYTYDYGSSTELRIRVLAEYPMRNRDGVTLLSRNEPWQDECTRCGNRAVSIVDDCSGEEPPLLCASCAEQLIGEDDEMSVMPIVNSPRCGVCGYEGGSIDKERDVFTPAG